MEVNSWNSEKKNRIPLIHSVFKNEDLCQMKTIQYLSEKKADFNLQHEKKIPLHLLCQKDNISPLMFEYVLERTNNFEIKDVMLFTPFQYLCRPGNNEIFLKFLHKYPPKDLIAPFTTLLSFELDPLKYKSLVELKLDPSFVNSFDSNPLHLISEQLITNENNYIEILKILLEYDNSINLKDKNGKTPLQHLVLNYSATRNIVSFFIYNGAKVNTIDNLGLSPLLNIFTRPRINYNLIAQLLLHKAEANFTLQEYTEVLFDPKIFFQI